MNLKDNNNPSSIANRVKAYLFGLSPTALVLAVFAILSLAYFSPAVFEGRDIFQGDVAGASGTAQDVRDYYATTGEVSYWTNSLFGGMPMYQISPSYPSLGVIKKVQDFLTLQWPLNLLPSYSWLLFAMLWGFYIFMRSLKQSVLLSTLGALMWCFSSYFIILIDAGHIWKLMVLAFIPPTIAGIVYTYERQYLKGGVITAFFASLQLMSNHVQMSYYFAFLIVCILLSYLYQAVRSKDYKPFLLSSLVTFAAASVSIAVNSSNLYHTYEYTQETMRGGSALRGDAEVPGAKKGGLDKDYITTWSYGKAETLTFLVPNVYGGASGYLGKDPDALDGLDGQTKEIVAQMNHYWGDQPFTSGPVYVGAFVLFLAILALFVVRTPLKWALLVATILSLLLAWGRNLMWFTDFFIDYVPLYNKFRTVSSILVIAEFTIPTLAVLGLLEFVREPQRFINEERTPVLVSLILTLGVASLIALVPSLFFDFISDQEVEMFRPYLADPNTASLISALKGVRAGIVSADAWRSVGVILVSLGVCWAYYKKWIRESLFLVSVIVITLLDLWVVDKRYLNDNRFVDTALIQAQATPVTEIDREIKKDTDPHYRVLNLSVSPFNDATTSFSHRSIGGYHAAKLGRYQDLIEHQISKQNKRVLNMLDMRYLILPNQEGKLSYERNPDAMGAAWLIAPEAIKVVNTPNEEMAALDSLDPKQEAVMLRSEMTDSTLPKEGAGQSDTSLGAIKLLEYSPNKAKYQVEANRDALAVFSEIYYPHGWTMTIDGQVVDILRANYLLRSAFISKGKHIVEMSFDPPSVQTTELISIIAQLLLLLSAVAFIITKFKKQNNITSHDA